MPCASARATRTRARPWRGYGNAIRARRWASRADLLAFPRIGGAGASELAVRDAGAPSLPRGPGRAGRIPAFPPGSAVRRLALLPGSRRALPAPPALRAGGPAGGRGTPVEPPGARGDSPLPARARLPADLLQLLRPDEFGISLVLAIHVPLAAIAFFAIARGSLSPRRRRPGAPWSTRSGASCSRAVNLYVYLQAAAWAPLLVLGLARVPGGAPGAPRPRGAALAVALSTTASRSWPRRSSVGIALGCARLGRLARRGRRVPASPLRWRWARRSRPRSCCSSRARSRAAPAAGASRPTSCSPTPFTRSRSSRRRRRALRQPRQPRGRVVGPELLPAGLPLRPEPLPRGRGPGARRGRRASGRRMAAPRVPSPLSPSSCRSGAGRGSRRSWTRSRCCGSFRFPVKAFFTAHFAVALLAALGLAALVAGRRRRAWRRLAAWAGGAGRPARPRDDPPAPPARSSRHLRGALLPPGSRRRHALAAHGRVLTDAAPGAWRLSAVRERPSWCSAGRSPPSRGAGLVIALVTADLLRPGPASTPWSPPRSSRPRRSSRRRLASLREGRVFTCTLEESPAYLAARVRPALEHELWSFASFSRRP